MSDTRIPYINPDVRYLGVSSLREMDQKFLSEMNYPIVLKKPDGTELVVIMPWEMFLKLQDAAEPKLAQVMTPSAVGKLVAKLRLFRDDQRMVRQPINDGMAQAFEIAADVALSALIANWKELAERHADELLLKRFVFELNAALAAHDQKVRAEVLEEAAKLAVRYW